LCEAGRILQERSRSISSQFGTGDVEPNKHSGVLAKFDELFVRQGIFPKEMSRILHHAFDMRQAGDYQKSRVMTEEQALEVLTSAEQFVKTIETKLLQS